MDEYKLISKITKIRKGNRVAVIPRFGAITEEEAIVGYECSSPEGSSVEIHEAFEAILEEFDGDILKLSTSTYPCLKVSVQDVGDIVDISRLEEISEEEEPLD